MGMVSLILVNVLYYRPDHPLILNEFTWQTLDIVPQLVRVNRFLRYWNENIDAVINEVMVSYEGGRTVVDWRKAAYECRIESAH